MKDVLQPQRALTVELFMKSFDVPQALITKMRLAMAPPDLLIRPPLDKDFGVEQFGRIGEAIEIGYAAADAALAGLRRSNDRRDEGERDRAEHGRDERSDRRDAHPVRHDDEERSGDDERGVTTMRR